MELHFSHLFYIAGSVCFIVVSHFNKTETL